MSISEFIVDNCIDVNNPDWMSDFLIRQHASESRMPPRSIVIPKLPNPETNDTWMALCRDSKYTSKKEQSELFAANWVQGDGQVYGPTTSEASKVCAAPDGTHPGALAPRFVFEATPTKLDHADNLISYRRRLLCAMHGRFVVIGRMGSTMQVVNHDKGIPEIGERHSWRYWDNDGIVYEDSHEKWRKHFSSPQADSFDTSEDFDYSASLPGNFDKSKVHWLRESGVTDLSTFWECMWSWRFFGTTGRPLWDKSLHRLSKSAVVGEAWDWPIDKAMIETENEKKKEWSLLECHQPAMVRFERVSDGALLNIDLSAAFVTSCWEADGGRIEHVFRRNVKDASVCFQSVPKSYGKAPQQQSPNKKRKSPSQERLRPCALCGEEKSNEDFSKNQRRRNVHAKCKTCVDAGRR
jgi:hypothetical protein